MKISFATLGCPDSSLEQIAATAQALGYDGVELRGIAGQHIGPEETPAERARIRKLFERHHIEIAAIMGYTYFTLDDPQQREEDIRVAGNFLETARDIGCPVLRVFGGSLSENLDWEGNVKRLAEGLRRLADKAERTGVTVALETHDGWTEGWKVKAALDAVGSPMIAACWDVANTSFVEPPETTVAAIGDRLAHVHFKDARVVDGRRKCTLLGQGEVDLPKAASLIASTGYTRYLSFEWEKQWDPELEEPELAFPHYRDFTRKLMAEMPSCTTPSRLR